MWSVRLIPSDTKIDFVGKRRVAFIVSAVLVVGSILAFLVQGLNFGIDFRGGILSRRRQAVRPTCRRCAARWGR